MTQNTTPSRRKLLTTGLGVLAAPAILRVLPANAQGRTLRIGHVSPRSGPLAAFGEAVAFRRPEVGARAGGAGEPVLLVFPG